MADENTKGGLALDDAEDAAEEAVSKFLGGDADDDAGEAGEEPDRGERRAGKRGAEPKAGEDDEDDDGRESQDDDPAGGENDDEQDGELDDDDELEDDEDDDVEMRKGKTKPGADYSRKAPEKKPEPKPEDTGELDVKGLADRFLKSGLLKDDGDSRTHESAEDRPRETAAEDEPTAGKKPAGRDREDPFAPLVDDATLKHLKEKFDPEVSKVFEAIDKRDRARAKLFKGILEYVQETAHETLLSRAHATTGVFRKLVSDGFAHIYGTNSRQLTDAEDSARAWVIRKGISIKKEMAAEGEYVSLEDAMLIAHAGRHREAIEKKAEERGRKSVEERVQRRHRQRDLEPATSRQRRGSGGGDREAEAAVGNWLRKRGLA